MSALEDQRNRLNGRQSFPDAIGDVRVAQLNGRDDAECGLIGSAPIMSILDSNFKHLEVLVVAGRPGRLPQYPGNTLDRFGRDHGPRCHWLRPAPRCLRPLRSGSPPDEDRPPLSRLIHPRLAMRHQPTQSGAQRYRQQAHAHGAPPRGRESHYDCDQDTILIKVYVPLWLRR